MSHRPFKWLGGDTMTVSTTIVVHVNFYWMFSILSLWKPPGLVLGIGAPLVPPADAPKHPIVAWRTRDFTSTYITCHCVLQDMYVTDYIDVIVKNFFVVNDKKQYLNAKVSLSILIYCPHTHSGLRLLTCGSAATR